MNVLIKSTVVALVFVSLKARAENQSPFISLMAAPFAAMDADTRRYEEPAPEQKKFNMNLHQGYGLRISAWNMYASFTESITERDSEIPNARFTAITAGFLVDEMDDTSYPVGLYTRFGSGLGSGVLHYANSSQDEEDLLWEVFAEGGLTFFHYYQLGLQGKMQGLFKVGDTRALLGEVAIVASVHF
jgi:hypothetical protein